MLLPSKKILIESLELTELEMRLLFTFRALNNSTSNSDRFESDGKKYKILVMNDENINIIIKER